jgi:hypothetical protein
MFNEAFFDHLDRKVKGFKERSGEELAAVVLRTRWGVFNIGKVRAEEVVLGVSVYANRPQAPERDDGLGTTEDGAAPPPEDHPPVAEDNQVEAEAPEKPKFAEIYVPYQEIISVELYPGAPHTAYLGGELGDDDPLIGFGRS